MTAQPSERPAPDIFPAGGPYARTWADFIGQTAAVEELRTAIASAQARQVPLDHVLLASGTPGIGKTNLAMLVAADLGAGYAAMGGDRPVTESQAARVILQLRPGDVLMIDELHTQARATWLLQLMADHVLHAAGKAIPAPAVTVIGATTDAGRLPRTLLDRFGHQPALERYTATEAARIAVKLAARLGFGTPALPLVRDVAWYAQVATASSRTPRTIGRILRLVRDVAYATGLCNWDGQRYDLDTPLRWCGLRPDGLSRLAIRYLLALHLSAGTMGERAVAETLGEPGGCRDAEFSLLASGLIARTARGRQLTAAGWSACRDLLEGVQQ